MYVEAVGFDNMSISHQHPELWVCVFDVRCGGAGEGQNDGQRVTYQNDVKFCLAP